ncbi:thioredoxin family protein [Saccharopolyspora sp. SCSIO 74807]|uniref:TlpA family protein disulfide reductase n=1 Tax=Saccharopolyspora sp. SCSIO 74807 TaxID=3118084 RepID=UPI0030D4B86B
MIGWWALLAAVAVTLVIGLVWRAREGRVRTAGKTAAGAGVAGTVLDQLPDGLRARLGDLDGSGVTLLQLSTTFCAPCRHTRILLADLAGRTEGMRHVEVDLTDHPEWSTPLGVHRTPTTLALDSDGHELFRVGGVPRRDELAAALRPHLP